jgi:chemotaxis family two-component system response regulator Rcp1
MLRESRQKRIVLVEDNPSDVFLLRRALEENSVDYTLEVIRDGEEALKYLGRLESGESVAPDLLILDLNLPRHDGIEVLTSCRETPSLRLVPIIVLTSSDSPKERERAEQLGVSDYVRKPIMLDEFMAVGGRISNLLAGRSAAP